ncbi:MAG: prepilin-type N-terminal cleavage/methylation domain-containing protein [Noviherbaspirillum sp.]
MDRDASAGFTLIELLISIAIVAILSAIAFPAYTDYFKRGRAAEALASLATLRVSLEQYYQDNRNYGADGSCGVAPPSGADFSYTCASSDNGQAFLATASGNSARGMAGFVYTIDHSGLRRTTGLPAGWGTPPMDCWIGSRGGAC